MKKLVAGKKSARALIYRDADGGTRRPADDLGRTSPRGLFAHVCGGAEKRSGAASAPGGGRNPAALNQRRQGKKELKTAAEYRAAVEKMLTRQRVSGLLEVEYLVKRREQQMRAWGSRPARVEVTETWSVRVRRDQAVIQAAQEQLGWRVYATNAPEERLSLTKAVLIYQGIAAA